MATFAITPAAETYREHVEVALGHASINAHVRNWCRTQADNVWDELNPRDRAELVRLVRLTNEARAVLVEAEEIYNVQHRAGSFDNTIAPKLVKQAWELSDSEINELQAYTRVLSALGYSLEAYRATLSNLLSIYQDHNLLNICGFWASEELNKVTQANNALGPYWKWLTKYCSSATFVARVSGAQSANTSAVAVDQDGTKIWVQAVDLDKNKPNKLWIWLAYDGTGKVVDRYVQKTESLPLPHWNRAKYWVRDTRRGFMPMEAYLQEKCWTQDNNGFVRIRHTTWDTKAFTIEYKIDYCPHGDLYTLFDRYFEEEIPIPEPILWYIFQKFAENCLIMRQGSANPPHKVPGWREIVHRDIKPANMFVDIPTPGPFPAYPTPKMADFGFAFETSATDASNPACWADSGTHPFFAPEQMVDIPTRQAYNGGSGDGGGDGNYGPEGHKIEKLLSHTNIWEIGMSMLELVNGSVFEALDQKHYPWGQPDEHETTAWAETHYSQGLLDLIRECVRFHPQDRKKADVLLGDVVAGMRNAPGAVGAYCRAAARGLQVEEGPFEWKMGREKYKVMMAG